MEEVGKVDLGRQRHPDWHHGPEMRPYLRVANVFEDRIDATDLKEMDFSGVFDRYKLQSGDVLLNEGQTPELLGRPAIYRGNPPDVAFTNSLLRFRAGPDVLPEWALIVFRRHMHFGRFARESRITTNIAHLSARRFKTVEFPVPPLHEQRRIADILEDHLSRLDAGQQGLHVASKRLRSYEQAALANCREGVSAPLCDVAIIQGGIQKQPRRAPRGNAFPFLRVANVTKDGLALDEVHQIELFGDELGRLRLQQGDLLVVEGNGSQSQIGRAAVWDGSIPDCVHQNHLIRVRPTRALQPEYLEAVWNSPQNRQQLMSLASSSSGLYTLSVSKLKSLSIPVPSIDRQEAIVRALADIRQRRARLKHEIDMALVRAARLRRSLLASAFSGQLIGRRSNTHRVEELMEAGVS